MKDRSDTDVDIVTDGETRRESYSNRFANALDGVDLDAPGEAIDRTGKAVPVPRVVGEISRRKAVNQEVLDLFAAGVDIVQLDEPYVQARPEAAREYAVAAIDRALQGATGPTVLHVCSGYGKHVDDKPPGYAFLQELDNCVAAEVSIECAQPRLNMDVLHSLPNKKIHVGVLDLRDTAVEPAEVIADRIRAALTVMPAAHCNDSLFNTLSLVTGENQ